MKKIFLDTNILLEIILDREKKALCISHLRESNSSLYISTLSVYIVYYVASKFLSKKEQIFEYLDQFNILDFSLVDYEIAKKILKGSDFEDSLQIACALRNKCQEFITLDKKLEKLYSSQLDMKLVRLGK